MAPISKSSRICETCGSPIETTSSGDLGCIACLIGTGLDAEAEQTDPAFTSAPDQLGVTRSSIMPMAVHGSWAMARWESLIARSIKRSIVRLR